MRKGLFTDRERVLTPVFDRVSQFVPDQSLSLRELLMQFAYMSGEKVEEIVNRGFTGDEDEDILGYDASQLDFTEIHDRLIDQMNKASFVREPKKPVQDNIEAVSVGGDKVEIAEAEHDEDA